MSFKSLIALTGLSTFTLARTGFFGTVNISSLRCQKCKDEKSALYENNNYIFFNTVQWDHYSPPEHHHKNIIIRPLDESKFTHNWVKRY